MRGKVDSPHIKITNAGITPAYAGKREFKNAAAGMDEDHPRLCGEKQLCQLFLCFVQGSPPPMRGKVVAASEQNRFQRITPAYAGKSFSVEAATSEYRDHPRLCGEKALNGFFLTYLLGSPPPMRGKGSVSGLRLVSVGITPAYAGKRICVGLASGVGRDHPRLCGEKIL